MRPPARRLFVFFLCFHPPPYIHPGWRNPAPLLWGWCTPVVFSSVSFLAIERRQPSQSTNTKHSIRPANFSWCTSWDRRILADDCSGFLENRNQFPKEIGCFTLWHPRELY